MSSIRISPTEVLEAKKILSFTASAQRKSVNSTHRELMLTIIEVNGQYVSLHGELAENAFAILRLHGS